MPFSLSAIATPTPAPVAGAAGAPPVAVVSTAPSLPPAPAAGTTGTTGTQGAQQPSIPLVNAPSAQQRQVLTQADEKVFETDLLAAIESDKQRDDAAKFRDQVITLTWPVIVLVLLILYRRTIDTIALSRKWTLALPGGVNIGVTDQLGTLPTQTQATAAESDVKQLLTHPVLSTMAAPDGIVRAAAPSADAAVKTAALNLEAYFARAAAKLVASQLMMLRAVSASDVDDAAAHAIFAAGVTRGLPLTFDQWLAYLTGYRFISTTRKGLRTTYSVSDLGREFLKWCDVHGVSEAVLFAQGRGA